MIRLLAALLSAAVLSVALSLAQCKPALADPPVPYTDRALHFAPPSTYESLPVPAVDISEQAHLSTVAAYVRNRGHEDQMTILIMMELFGGPLQDFEALVENELRGQIEGVFVSRKTATHLPNGMPAYWLKIAFGDGFDSMQEYLYAAVDGRRGVTVSVVGRLGVINEDAAKDALKDLALVVYP